MVALLEAVDEGMHAVTTSPLSSDGTERITSPVVDLTHSSAPSALLTHHPAGAAVDQESVSASELQGCDEDVLDCVAEACPGEDEPGTAGVDGRPVVVGIDGEGIGEPDRVSRLLGC
jgi:hypothetical protein